MFCRARLWPLAEGQLSACHVGCQGKPDADTAWRPLLLLTLSGHQRRTTNDTGMDASFQLS